MKNQIDTNTHNKTVQAGYGLLLQTLQRVYDRIPALGIECVARPGEASSSHSSPAEKNEAQEALLTYLKRLIPFIKAPIAEIDQKAWHVRKIGLVAKLAPLIKTTSVIDEIVLNERHSLQDKKTALNVLSKICQKYPGGEHWTGNDAHWSVNQYYDAKTNRMKAASASPAETLNLVCNALKDKSRLFKRREEDADEGQNIERLVRQLTRLETVEGERNKCAAGLQHDLLSVLDRVFLIEDRPIRLPVDQASLLQGFLAEFISQALSHATSEEAACLVANWITWHNSVESTDESPLLKYLQAAYPSAEPHHPDAAWTRACQAFISQRGNEYGLNPADYQPSDYANSETVQALSITSIEHPAIDATVQIAQNILEMQPMPNPNQDELIQYRNMALEQFKADCTPHRAGLIHVSQEARHLYRALSVFDVWYEFRQGMLLVGSEDETFQTSRNQLQTDLLEYFTDHPGKPLSKEFESSIKTYKAHIGIFQRETSSLINDFFALEAELSRAERQALFNRILQFDPACLVLQDEALDHLAREALYREANNRIVMALTPEIANRIFFHGMVRPTPEWSDKYCDFVTLLTDWLLQEETDADCRLKAFRKAYSSQMLLNVQWISHVHRTQGIEPEIKAVLIQSPNAPFSGLLTHNYDDNFINFLESPDFSEQDKQDVIDALDPGAAWSSKLLFTVIPHPEPRAHFLSALERLDSEKLFEILKIKNEQGETVCHIAAEYPKLMKQLVPLLEKLKPEKLSEILQIENKLGETVFHIAERYPKSRQHLNRVSARNHAESIGYSGAFSPGFFDCEWTEGETSQPIQELPQNSCWSRLS